jgi:hypothetical protein
MKRIWNFVALGICSMIAILAPGAAQAAPVIMIVDCSKGQTITDALARGQGVEELEIQFSGGCRERVLIVRDRVTLRGVGDDPVLFGFIDVEGASKVTLSDFSIRGGGVVPPSARFGGINVTQGGAASLLNLGIEGLPGRGVRVVSATADLQDVTVERSLVGFEFYTAQINLAGSIVANDNAAGMMLFTSGMVARANLSFGGNADYGLVVQLASSFTHIRGQLSAKGSQIGILISANGSYGFTGSVDIRDNIAYGLVVEDLSSITAFRGGGPSLTVTGNPIGISVTRGATADFFGQTLVTANGVGLEVDEGLVRLEGVTVRDNSEGNMKLGFASRATFVGEGNSLGGPLQCHETALARGSIGCGASLTAAPTVKSSRLSKGVELRELLSRILQ